MHTYILVRIPQRKRVTTVVLEVIRIYIYMYIYIYIQLCCTPVLMQARPQPRTSNNDKLI